MISEIKYGASQREKYELTVIILVYEQELKKILLTIASALAQINVDMQIIISDDGSREVPVQECVDYLEENKFNDYKFIVHNENQGTVMNYQDALKISSGEYVKAISPGDCFSTNDCLRSWIDCLKGGRGQVSFCDAVYYSWNDGKMQSVVEVAHPQETRVYRESKALQKKYYLLYNDIFLGAAILAERKIISRYIQEICGKVKYAEDNAYRLMMLDGITFVYFNDSAIFYEWGSGISTQANTEFRRKIDQDWESASREICERCGRSFVEKMIKCSYKRKEEKLTLTERLYAQAAHYDIMKYQSKNKGSKRLTSMQNLDYLNALDEKVAEYIRNMITEK